MAAGNSGNSGAVSILVVEELFVVGDERFLSALRQCVDGPRLKAFATRWAADVRPWARSQLFAYLNLPLDAAGHRSLVKRLFKDAEAKRDEELMGAFAVAFDRLVRRVRRKEHKYDWRTRQSWTEEVLYSPQNTVPDWVVAGQNPKTLQPTYYTPRRKRPLALFSYHTRYYLRRRAWRYFRRMGHQRPGDYPAAVARFLARYRDADLARGENLLDSWSLLHAAFGRSAVIEFDAARAAVRDGRSLGELTAAPDVPELWKAPAASRVLLRLVVAAGARLVRVWAVELLRRDHLPHLAGIAPADLLPLLDHADEELQQFGAQLLENAAGLATLPVAEWLRLLQTRSLTALETIARLMRQHVHAGRVTLFEAVTLATAEPTPVARLGLDLLKARPIATPQERQAVSNLARARCAGLGREIAGWALGSVLGRPEAYDVEQVTRFFDSLTREVREGAWAWLAEGTPGWTDPVLWTRLLETPYDDLRLRLVEVLTRRSKLPGANAGDLAPVWTTVLLNVHRGGRHKLAALRQVSAAIRNDPARAAALVPVLAVAIRSVRPPEARAGLSAIVTAVAAQPSLADAVKQHLPELDLSAEEVTA